MPKDKYYSYFKTSTSPGDVPTWKQNMTNHTYFPDVVVPTHVCSIQFEIPDDLKPPVLFYYRLTNFYQNHRRYVKSLDTDQLLGHAVPASTISTSACDPLRNDEHGKPYYPCGLIANSLFNDTFASPVFLNPPDGSDADSYFMTDKGIAWASDADLYGETQYKNFSDIAVPRNWAQRWPDTGYDQDHPPPNLHNDEAFQVWMRTAGLPAFSKLARRNDNQTMQKGRYQVDIEMSEWPHYLSWTPWLKASRLSRSRIWRDQIHCDLNSNRYGWEKSVPGYCLCCCRRNLHCPRGFVYNRASHQA